MIMIGVHCEKCGVDLLDCGTECFHCHHPYNEFVLNMVAGHRRAKEEMIARAKTDGDTSEERLFSDVMKLAASSVSLAETHKVLKQNGSLGPLSATIKEAFSGDY